MMRTRLIPLALTVFMPAMLLGCPSANGPTTPASTFTIALASGDASSLQGVALDGAGGLWAAGRRSLGGNNDLLVYRIGASGNVLLEATVGGVPSETTDGLIAVSAGGVLVYGSELISPMAGSTLVVRLDQNGQELWRFTKPNSSAEVAIEAADGGFIIGTGLPVNSLTPVQNPSPASVFKLDADGNLIWDAPAGLLSIRGLAERANGDIYALSFINQGGQTGGLSAVILDSAGSVQATNELRPDPAESYFVLYADVLPDGNSLRVFYADFVGGALYLDEVIGLSAPLYRAQRRYDPEGFMSAATPAPDGGFILVGTNDTSASNDAQASKVDAQLREQWRTILGGNNDDMFNAIAVNPDGSSFAVGSTESFSTSVFDGYVVKLDTFGMGVADPANSL